MTMLRTPSKDENPFLSTIQAAKFLGLAPKTLSNMRCKGSGPIYRKHAHIVFYHIDDLIDYSNKRRFGSTGGSDG